MSIASRITSIEGHIEEDYNALERLGADLTNVDKNIENIASVVNDIYDKLPKVTGTGSNVSLTPTLKGGLGINPLGNCEQNTTTGTQLIGVVDGTYQSNEEEITAVVSNGIITLNGTATQTNFVPIIAYTNYSSIAIGDSFTISANNPVSSNYVSVRTNPNSVYDITCNSVNKIQTFTLLENRPLQQSLTIRVGNGVSLSNYILKPQLEKGSTSTSWNKYTGGIPSPNPSFPQSIKVVTGDNQVLVSTGNLLDSKGGFEKGYISASGVFNEEDYTALFNQYIPVEENQVLTLSSKLNLRSCAFLFYNSEKTFISRSANSNITTFTVTTPLNTKYVKIQASHQTQTITQEIINTLELQVEYGSSASSYKEYKGIQSTTLHLGSLELCKIGDYQDVITGSKDNWKVVRNVGKRIFTGVNATSLENLYICMLSDYLNQYGFCSHFTFYTDTLINNNADADSILSNGECAFRSGSTKDRLYFKSTKTKAELDLLNKEVYYVLSEPTEETITDTTLINELNSLQDLLSYDGTTNITITSDSSNAQMLSQVSALKGE